MTYSNGDTIVGTFYGSFSGTIKLSGQLMKSMRSPVVELPPVNFKRFFFIFESYLIEYCIKLFINMQNI